MSDRAPDPISVSLPEGAGQEACPGGKLERRIGKETDAKGNSVFWSLPKTRTYCVGCGPTTLYTYEPGPSWKPGVGRCVLSGRSSSSSSSTSPPPAATTPSTSQNPTRKDPDPVTGKCGEGETPDSSRFVEGGKKFCMVCPTNTTYKPAKLFGLGTCVAEKSGGMETRLQKQQRQAREAKQMKRRGGAGGAEEKKFCIVCSPQNRVGGVEAHRSPSVKKIQIKYNKQSKIMWYENGKRVAGSKLSPDVRLYVMRKYEQSKQQKQQQQQH